VTSKFSEYAPRAVVNLKGVQISFWKARETDENMSLRIAEFSHLTESNKKLKPDRLAAFTEVFAGIAVYDMLYHSARLGMIEHTVIRIDSKWPRTSYAS